MSEPSCYKPKCKDCPVKDDCENFKPEIIYKFDEHVSTGSHNSWR